MLPRSPVARLVSGTAVVLSTCTAPGLARADAESDAKDLFARGRELRQRSDCGSAAPLFRKAYALHPRGLGSLRNLAECEEQIGRFASARRAWLDLKRALVTAPPEAKYAGWERDADEAAARLRPKVASFVVDVYVRSSAGEELATERSGVELFVNGESIGTKLASTPLERDPGTYRIRAQAEGAAPVEQLVNLSAGDNPHVTIRLARTLPETAATAPASPATAAGPATAERPAPAERGLATDTPPSSPTDDPGAGRRTAGWLTLGLGGAALVASGVTLLLRQAALAELERGCPGYETGPCPRTVEGDVDRGELMSTLTSVLFPVGLVGAGVGAALVLTAPRPGSRAVFGPTITAGPTRIGATWRF